MSTSSTQTALSIACLFTGGGYVTFIPAALAVVWAVTTVRQVRKIRALEAPRRCPDYGRIAALEIGIYGRVFPHDGAPGETWAREDNGTMYRADCVSIPHAHDQEA
jgi:hypothetical protein